MKLYRFIEFKNGKYQTIKDFYLIKKLAFERNFEVNDLPQIIILSEEENIYEIGMDYIRNGDMKAIEVYTSREKLIVDVREITPKFTEFAGIVFLEGFYLPREYEYHNQVVIDGCFPNSDRIVEIGDKTKRNSFKPMIGYDEIIIIPTKENVLKVLSN